VIGITTGESGRKNGRVLWIDGTHELPECTNAKIDARGAKATVIQEYVRRVDPTISATWAGASGYCKVSDFIDPCVKILINTATPTVSTAAIGYKEFTVAYASTVTFLSTFYGTCIISENNVIRSMPFEVIPINSMSFNFKVYTSPTNGLSLFLPRQVITIQQD
jgi:hypothetical protein